MPSTYSNNLRIELPATGEQQGVWGNTTNTNLGTLLEQAIAGVKPIALADADYTLTVYNGASDESRNAVLVFTGTLTAQRSITAPSSTKEYVIANATTGGFPLRIKTSGSTTTTLIPANTSRVVFTDGTEFYFADSGISANAVYKDSSTGAGYLPAGTTAQRPSSPAPGYIRYNSTNGRFEGYGANWGSLGGATGGGTDAVFYENSNTVYYPYTISTNSNAMTSGPITISGNQNVTSVSIASGGTGYTVGDVLTLTGGTFAAAAQVVVTTVSTGVITGVSIALAGSYSVFPTPAGASGGTGASAAFNLTGSAPTVTVPSGSVWHIL